MTLKMWFAIALVTAASGVAALNQYGIPVPGLEWVRVDTLASKIGLSDKTPAATATDANGGSGGRRGGGRRGGQDGPVPVVVAAAGVADVPVYLRGVGAARAQNTVTVKPQVDGKLIKVHFREGQDVKKGDLLAEIDPVTYQAALDQATAKRNLTQSILTNAQLDLDRYSKVGPGVTAQKTIDTQRALVAQTEAQLRSDTAAIANAQAVLNYTKLLSPLDGRTGQRLVDEGNLVRAGDAGIVTIAQIKPISVQFTLPQQQLAQVTAAMATGTVQVEAMDGDDKTVIDSGALTFIDNLIDATTGTVRMKADLPNDRLQLWPGQFANVRVRVEVLKDSITAPAAAVQRGPLGTFVYVVGGESAKQTVSVRAVTVAQQDDRLAVISKGLSAGDQVVTSGFARLKDQAQVTIARGGEGDSKDGKEKDGMGSGKPGPPDQTSQGREPAAAVASPAPQTGSTVQPDTAARAEGERGKGERRGKRKQESALQ
ncbi:MAG: efflux RND transporter periplasmic adaptor subunit [Hyphomicrobiaceae bacterium]